MGTIVSDSKIRHINVFIYITIFSHLCRVNPNELHAQVDVLKTPAFGPGVSFACSMLDSCDGGDAPDMLLPKHEPFKSPLSEVKHACFITYIKVTLSL